MAPAAAGEGPGFRGMPFARLGSSGALVPTVSLGLWNNFGADADDETCRRIVFEAFDRGITHFDLANNYGPPPGSAEERFGKILKHLPRDEILISTKAGYLMWDGPYGNWGSRKYLLASLDQSLRRLQVDYVDIFYHHRPDPDTPVEESMGALDQAVRLGKALYVGISNYGPEGTREAARILRELGTPFIIHQPKYSMLVRTPEEGLLDVLEEEGIGGIVFSPLAQGLLTDRYLGDIPADSRAAKDWGFLDAGEVTDDLRARLRCLGAIAERRGQSLAQMAVAWVLRQPAVTSALVGASRVQQIEESVAALDRLEFAPEELSAIDDCLAG